MNELAEGTQIPRETLTLEPQVPMLIPKEIKDLRLAGQLPQGDIAYIDLEDFNTVRLVDQTTWKPVTKKGVETRFNLDKIVGRSFPAIIFVTPPRTKDYPLDSEVQELSGLLRRTSKREEGFIKEQYLGTLFVVETRSGVDEKKNWREKQMRENGLVIDKKRGESAVVITDDFIISQGRRPMQKGPVDLTKGKVSHNMFTDFTDAIERGADAQGITADTTRLKNEARKTRFVPGTISNLREGENVTYRGFDEDGKPVETIVDEHGYEYTSESSRNALKGKRMTPEKPTPKTKINPFVAEATVSPGRLVQTNKNCFKSHSDGQGKVLSVILEPVMQTDGSFQSRIFWTCPTHGRRFDNKAPAYQDALNAVSKKQAR